jgi:uncharacterized membrane protein
MAEYHGFGFPSFGSISKLGFFTLPPETCLQMAEKQRIPSIDLIRGLIMIIMVLDHVRHFFHFPVFFFSPEDPERATLPIFFTRWITHYCAPGFFLLSGVSAWLSGQKKTRSELALFLLTRGLWLMFFEIAIISFGWTFDLEWKSIPMQVIWALGLSMVCLSGLIFLPRAFLAIFSSLLIFGHNALDDIVLEGNFLWAILHQGGFFQSGPFTWMVIYPLVPWVAVMVFGYVFGPVFGQETSWQARRKTLNAMGFTFLILFFLLRSLQWFGDPIPWQKSLSPSGMVIQFLNPLKYPPSLHFLAMTLGPIFILLVLAEKLKSKFWEPVSVFGRVPFFFYLLHLYLLHLLGFVWAFASGRGAGKMVMHDWESFNLGLQGFGFGLPGVYAIWLAVVVFLFPVCHWYDRIKTQNKHLKILSYL